ncbi:hypothetical protein [Luteipulveratus mongoliensis]|uniref:DUF5047 domain-containing protein n=1 Tax=Luteipulveratus mongoliensis TaxID=571913 RepID=A0A0K1JGB8_9MICO|nr:hypothetical protein [Luteipulveratus mongoliensis]AKU15741.1 hypothetical protein VV02_07570 [Luteipulveratus mongoliensis]
MDADDADVVGGDARVIRGSAGLEAALSAPHSPAVYGEVWIGRSRIPRGTIEIADGNVSQSGSSFARREGSVEIVSTRETREMLQQPGACVRLWSGVQGVSSRIPVMWGVVAKTSRDWGGASLSIPLDDLATRVVRDRFPTPRVFTVPTLPEKPPTVPEMILALWRDSIPWCGWDDQSADATPMHSITWDEDRAQGIADLAGSIGCETWLRPDGVVVLQQIPSIRTAPYWHVQQGARLSKAQYETDRSKSYNHIVVTNEAGTARGEYADYDSPSGIDRCGRVLGKITTDAVATNAQCVTAAHAAVLRSQGERVSVSYEMTRHPGVEASDVHQIGTSEDNRRVVIDSVNFDLFGAGMQATGRTPTQLPEIEVS